VIPELKSLGGIDRNFGAAYTCAMEEPQGKEFEEVLKRTVGVMRVITLAMGGGLLMMAGVVVLLFLRAGPKAAPPSDGILPMLSAVHAFMVVSCYAAGWFVAEQQLKSPSSAPVVKAAEAVLTPEERALLAKARDEAGVSPAAVTASRVQTAEIIRLATREGPALLGLVVCFLAALSGVASRQPAYWLNGLSTVLFWGLALNEFPSEDRYRELFRRVSSLSLSRFSSPSSPGS
jgi:hypothetical protein